MSSLIPPKQASGSKMLDEDDSLKSLSISLVKDPHNISLWQSLIHAAECQDGLTNTALNQTAVENLRMSFSAFLKDHPLFLKYWVAYASWERKLNHNDKAEDIFVKALQFGSGDVSLWVSYLKFKIETITNNIDQLLQLFETARFKIGYHYHSFEFYELYLEFLETYADKQNKFREKSIILLRILLEIPLYNYAASFQRILQFCSSSSSTIDDFSLFMHPTNLKALKKLTRNDKKAIHEGVKLLIRDAYIVTQAKSYELFEFERKIINNNSSVGVNSISSNQLEIWEMYFNAVEVLYPYEYVIQLYERSCLSTKNHKRIVSKYFDFCVNSSRLCEARNMLRKRLYIMDHQASVHFLIRLSDLEIAMGNTISAKDMISKYILVNSNVPNSVFEKLLHVETLLNPGDEEYLCSLVHELVLTTKSPIFLEKLRGFPLSKSSVRSLLLRFIESSLPEGDEDTPSLVELKDLEVFWRTLVRISKDADLEEISIPKKFEGIR